MPPSGEGFASGPMSNVAWLPDTLEVALASNVSVPGVASQYANCCRSETLNAQLGAEPIIWRQAPSCVYSRPLAPTAVTEKDRLLLLSQLTRGASTVRLSVPPVIS